MTTGGKRDQIGWGEDGLTGSDADLARVHRRRQIGRIQLDRFTDTHGKSFS